MFHLHNDPPMNSYEVTLKCQRVEPGYGVTATWTETHHVQARSEWDAAAKAAKSSRADMVEDGTRVSCYRRNAPEQYSIEGLMQQAEAREAEATPAEEAGW